METEKRRRGPKERGPVSARVAKNIREVREERRLNLDELSNRLRDLGWSIAKSGLSKIESGQRGVDVDDLVALAIALETNVNRLLLAEDAADDDELALTPSLVSTSKAAWAWLCGEFVAGAGKWPWARFAKRGGSPNELQRFQQETRPHDPPIWLSAEETARLTPLRRAFDDIYFAMKEHDFKPEDFHKVIGMYAQTTWSTFPKPDLGAPSDEA